MEGEQTDADVFLMALVTIFLALAPKRKVERVSDALKLSGDRQSTIVVRELPPSASCCHGAILPVSSECRSKHFQR